MVVGVQSTTAFAAVFLFSLVVLVPLEVHALIPHETQVKLKETHSTSDTVTTVGPGRTQVVIDDCTFKSGHHLVIDLGAMVLDAAQTVQSTAPNLEIVVTVRNSRFLDGSQLWVDVKNKAEIETAITSRNVLSNITIEVANNTFHNALLGIHQIADVVVSFAGPPVAQLEPAVATPRLNIINNTVNMTKVHGTTGTVFPRPWTALNSINGNPSGRVGIVLKGVEGWNVDVSDNAVNVSLNVPGARMEAKGISFLQSNLHSIEGQHRWLKVERNTINVVGRRPAGIQLLTPHHVFRGAFFSISNNTISTEGYEVIDNVVGIDTKEADLTAGKDIGNNIVGKGIVQIVGNTLHQRSSDYGGQSICGVRTGKVEVFQEGRLTISNNVVRNFNAAATRLVYGVYLGGSVSLRNDEMRLESNVVELSGRGDIYGVAIAPSSTLQIGIRSNFTLRDNRISIDGEQENIFGILMRGTSVTAGGSYTIDANVIVIRKSGTGNDVAGIEEDDGDNGIVVSSGTYAVTGNYINLTSQTGSVVSAMRYKKGLELTSATVSIINNNFNLSGTHLNAAGIRQMVTMKVSSQSNISIQRNAMFIISNLQSPTLSVIALSTFNVNSESAFIIHGNIFRVEALPVANYNQGRLITIIHLAQNIRLDRSGFQLSSNDMTLVGGAVPLRLRLSTAVKASVNIIGNRCLVEGRGTHDVFGVEASGTWPMTIGTHVLVADNNFNLTSATNYVRGWRFDDTVEIADNSSFVLRSNTFLLSSNQDYADGGSDTVSVFGTTGNFGVGSHSHFSFSGNNVTTRGAETIVLIHHAAECNIKLSSYRLVRNWINMRSTSNDIPSTSAFWKVGGSLSLGDPRPAQLQIAGNTISFGRGAAHWFTISLGSSRSFAPYIGLEGKVSLFNNSFLTVPPPAGRKIIIEAYSGLSVMPASAAAVVGCNMFDDVIIPAISYGEYLATVFTTEKTTIIQCSNCRVDSHCDGVGAVGTEVSAAGECRCDCSDNVAYNASDGCGPVDPVIEGIDLLPALHLPQAGASMRTATAERTSVSPTLSETATNSTVSHYVEPIATPADTSRPAVAPNTTSAPSTAATGTPLETQNPPPADVQNSTATSSVSSPKSLSAFASDIGGEPWSQSFSHSAIPNIPRSGVGARIEDAVIKVLDSQVVAEVSVATSTASSAIASVLSNPTIAARASRIGTVFTSAACLYNEDDVDPELLQYLASPTVEAFGGTESAAAPHALGALTSAAFMVVAVLLPIVLSMFSFTHKVASMAARIAAMVVAMYTASVAEGAIFVFRWYGPSPHSGAQIAAAAVSISVVALILIAMAYGLMMGFCHQATVNEEPDSVSGTVKPFFVVKHESQWSCLVLSLIEPVVDAWRVGSGALGRVYFFEELVVSGLLGLVAGWRPESGTCLGVALAMVVISIAHAAYLTLVRPYLRRLDAGFSLGFAVLLVLQSGFAVWVTTVAEAERSSSLPFKILVGIVLAQTWGFIGQLLVQGVWMIAVSHRRKIRRLDNAGGTTTGNDKETRDRVEDGTAVPLLTIAGSADDTSAQFSHNPLLY